MKRFLAILTAAVVLAALPCSAAPGVGDKLSISVTNKYGDVFTNLTVVQIVEDGLVLEHKSGQMKVKFENLPESVRETYQPLAAVIAEKKLEHGKSLTAYETEQARLQADATKAREQREKQLANLPLDKSIEVPDQGWKIVLLDLEFTEIGRKVTDEQFVYQASGKDGFSLVIFVENPPGTGVDNDDVFNYYWPRTQRNPPVDAETLKAERAPNFIRVSYMTADTSNLDYYFMFRGKWVNVHLSKATFSEADNKVLNDFDSHLSYF